MALPALAQADELYRLRPGDKLEIWSAQDTTLNRQVSVAPDGRIAVPMAGHLQAAGLAPEELEQRLAERLRKYYREPLELTVILAGTTSEEKAATIYVVGDVERPGVYPFRNNMVVLHAVSAAGGFLRPARGLGPDPAGAKREELSATTRKLGQVLLKEARLRAELDDRTSIEVTDPADLKTNPQLARALRQEEAVLAGRRTTFQAKLQSRERILDNLKREVKALESQLEGAQKTVESQQKDQDVIKGLAQKGLVTGARETDAARLTNLAVSQKQDAQVRLIKAQGAYSEAAASLPDLREQHRLDLISELQQVWHEAGDLRARRALLANAAGGDGAGPKIYTYEVLRTVSGALQTVPAGELQAIEPGDLVRVTARIASDPAEQLPGAPQADAPHADAPHAGAEREASPS